MPSALLPPHSDPLGGNPLDDDPDFILDDDAPESALSRPVWAAPRSPRQKLNRGALVAAIVTIATVTLLGGPGSIAAFFAPQAAGAQPVSLLHARASHGGTAFDAPAAAGDNPDVRVVPVSGSLGLAYACWIAVARPQLDLLAGPLHVEALDPVTHRWRPLPLPAASAVRCDLTADAVDQQSAVLALWSAPDEAPSCALPALYYTADRGQHWTGVPWSALARPSCDVSMSLVASQMYVASSTPLLDSAALPPQTAARVIVSDDLGASWRPADIGMAGFASFELVAVRPSGRLLAQAEQTVPRPVTSLWRSADAGHSWQSLGPLPGTASRAFASSDASRPGDWARLYVASDSPLGNEGPARTVYLAAANLPPLAGTPPLPGAVEPPLVWTAIPPPPVSISIVGRPMGTSLLDAGEGPGATFLYLQPLTNTTPYIILPEFRIWVWDDLAHSWTLDHYAIPPNANLQGVSWNAGRMAVWLTTFGGGLTASVKVQTSAIAAPTASGG
ncbi:MAG: hypothetical protein ACHQ4H_02220 [Ktedonobacterales bacterium]